MEDCTGFTINHSFHLIFGDQGMFEIFKIHRQNEAYSFKCRTASPIPSNSGHTYPRLEFKSWQHSYQAEIEMEFDHLK